jgi:hypothetical protein
MERVELWDEQQAVVFELEVALGYVKAVKQALSPTAYAQFLDVLQAYREDKCVSPRGLGPLHCGSADEGPGGGAFPTGRGTVVAITTAC